MTPDEEAASQYYLEVPGPDGPVVVQGEQFTPRFADEVPDGEIVAIEEPPAPPEP